MPYRSVTELSQEGNFSFQLLKEARDLDPPNQASLAMTNANNLLPCRDGSGRQNKYCQSLPLSPPLYQRYNYDQLETLSDNNIYQPVIANLESPLKTTHLAIFA